MPQRFTTKRLPGSHTTSYELKDHIATTNSTGEVANPHPQYVLRSEYGGGGGGGGDLSVHINDPNAHATYYVKKEAISTSNVNDANKIPASSLIFQMEANLNTAISQRALLNHTHSLADLGAADKMHTHDGVYLTVAAGNDFVKKTDIVSELSTATDKVPSVALLKQQCEILANAQSGIYMTVDERENYIYKSQIATSQSNSTTNVPSCSVVYDLNTRFINHDHAGVYAVVNHTHSLDSLGAAAANHNHDGRYALISHNHDGVYAVAAHTHPYVSEDVLSAVGIYPTYTIEKGTTEEDPETGGTITELLDANSYTGLSNFYTDETMLNLPIAQAGWMRTVMTELEDVVMDDVTMTYTSAGTAYTLQTFTSKDGNLTYVRVAYRYLDNSVADEEPTIAWHWGAWSQTGYQPPASTTVSGVTRLATVTEATTGTSTEIAVTPAGLKSVTQAAIAAVHTHSNKAILDKIEQGGDATRLQFNGIDLVQPDDITWGTLSSPNLTSLVGNVGWDKTYIVTGTPTGGPESGGGVLHCVPTQTDLIMFFTSYATGNMYWKVFVNNTAVGGWNQFATAGAVALKANVADVYNKSQTYNKDEVNALLETAGGAISVGSVTPVTNIQFSDRFTVSQDATNPEMVHVEMNLGNSTYAFNNAAIDSTTKLLTISASDLRCIAGTPVVLRDADGYQVNDNPLIKVRWNGDNLEVNFVDYYAMGYTISGTWDVCAIAGAAISRTVYNVPFAPSVSLSTGEIVGYLDDGSFNKLSVLFNVVNCRKLKLFIGHVSTITENKAIVVNVQVNQTTVTSGIITVVKDSPSWATIVFASPVTGHIDLIRDTTHASDTLEDTSIIAAVIYDIREEVAD